MAYSGYGDSLYTNAYSQEFLSKNWTQYASDDTIPLDAAVYRQKVQAYLDRINNAQNTYNDALKAVEKAKQRLDSAEKAQAEKTAARKTAQDNAEQAKATLDTATGMLKQAQATLDNAQATLKQAQQTKTDTDRRAAILADA